MISRRDRNFDYRIVHYFATDNRQRIVDDHRDRATLGFTEGFLSLPVQITSLAVKSNHEVRAKRRAVAATITVSVYVIHSCQ